MRDEMSDEEVEEIAELIGDFDAAAGGYRSGVVAMAANAMLVECIWTMANEDINEAKRILKEEQLPAIQALLDAYEDEEVAGHA